MRKNIKVVRRLLKAAMAICMASACSVASAAAEAEGIWTVPVRQNVFAIMGAGGNITVQSGEQGLMVVDTADEQHAAAVLALIRSMTDKPIRYVVTTHDDAMHRGGNALIAMAGIKFGIPPSSGVRDEQSADIIAHENVLTSMSMRDPPPPFEGWPTSTFYTDSKTFSFNQEGVDIFLVPKSHSGGDTMVYFRQSNVISAGDIYTPDRYPYFDAAHGGSLQGVIDGLNQLIDLTITENMQEGGTLVVPGHGRIGNESDVVAYRDMLTIVRNYIQEMIREKRSLAQIQKARPTFGFDPLYAEGTTEWTVEEFVAATYRELTQKKGRK